MHWETLSPLRRKNGTQDWVSQLINNTSSTQTCQWHNWRNKKKNSSQKCIKSYSWKWQVLHLESKPSASFTNSTTSLLSSALGQRKTHSTHQFNSPLNPLVFFAFFMFSSSFVHSRAKTRSVREGGKQLYHRARQRQNILAFHASFNAKCQVESDSSHFSLWQGSNTWRRRGGKGRRRKKRSKPHEHPLEGRKVTIDELQVKRDIHFDVKCSYTEASCMRTFRPHEWKCNFAV